MKKTILISGFALGILASTMHSNLAYAEEKSIQNVDYFSVKQECGTALKNAKLEVLEGTWGPKDTIQYDASSNKFKINFYMKQNFFTQYLYLVQDAQDGTMFDLGNGEGGYNQLLQFDVTGNKTTSSYIFYLTALDPISNSEIRTKIKFYRP